MSSKYDGLKERIIANINLRAECIALGMRFTGDNVTPAGYWECWAIGRDPGDHANAGIHHETGHYRDLGENGESLSFFELAAKVNGTDWRTERQRYADIAGVKIDENGNENGSKKHKNPIEFRDLNRLATLLWCDRKRGVTYEGLQAADARLCGYTAGPSGHTYVCVGIPISGETGVNGHVLWNTTGGSLPTRSGAVKMLSSPGSEQGMIFIGSRKQFAAAKIVWKTEGPSDALTLWAAIPAELRAEIAVCTNSSGSGGRPLKWWLDLCAGKTVHVIHDCDKPGQSGAAKWLSGLVGCGITAKNVALPYACAENHGKDLRDWLTEGHTYADLVALADAATQEPPKLPIINGVESDDGIIPLQIESILDRIWAANDGWPRRVGDALFSDRGNGKIEWHNSVPKLFSSLGAGREPPLIHRAPGTHGREDIYARLQVTAPEYVAVEEYPHVPPISGHYYLHRDWPQATGTALEAFLGHFNATTDLDRELLLAAVLTPAWGGPYGARPAFLVTSDDGRGAGKSIVASLIGRLYGGHISLIPGGDFDAFKTRLLSGNSVGCRVISLDNVKSHHFSWAEFESLITEQWISGKRLYVGEFRRPNTLTPFITLNGASLSADLAQRTIVAKLSSAQYTGDWLTEVNRFIDNSRDAILADVQAILSAPGHDLTAMGFRFSRWGAWENYVLARVAHPVECQQLIRDRQQASDLDAEQGAIIEAVFKRHIEELYNGYDIFKRGVIVPAVIAAKWIGEALGERHKSTVSMCRALRQYIDEGQVSSIRFAGKIGREKLTAFYWEPPGIDYGLELHDDLEEKMLRVGEF